MIKRLKYLLFHIISYRANHLFASKLKLILPGKDMSEIKSDQVKKYNQYWGIRGLKVNKNYFRLYASISSLHDFRFVPENLYYTFFEPSLNNRSMVKTYSNKNLYQIVYNNPEIFPQTYLKCINGTFYNDQNEPIAKIKDWDRNFSAEKLIVKLSLDSGGGRGVELFQKSGSKFISNKGTTFDPAVLRIKFGDDFVVQEYIEQHSYFKKLNESSVNTVRVFTYRSVTNEVIHILHTILRIGLPGSIVDNQASGGLSCGIKNGKLNSFAIDKKGNKTSHINGYALNSLEEIPLFTQIIDKAKEIGRQNHYARLLGLDFCVTSDNQVKLLEVNNQNNEINFYQMNNGSLFGDFTDEIITWCKQHPKTVCLDFTV